MIILSIETSCDETAISIVEAIGDLSSPTFKVLGNALYSQVALHAEYGGVYPNLAKREHAKNLVPLLKDSLKAAFAEASVARRQSLRRRSASEARLSEEKRLQITDILSKEHGLAEQTLPFLEQNAKPTIDMIAVTAGPGLEPALWVGISFAKALALAWDVPLAPTNHMKGHIASVLLDNTRLIKFPALALLISGNHTEIVLMKDWNTHTIMGQTRDDAIGEAFDKVARMLDLPYPGGPKISKLAQIARDNPPSPEALARQSKISLPRPMLHSKDLDFSFSGLKTSVLYLLRDLREKNMEITEELKSQIAREFEDAVTEVLLNKVTKALDETGAETLILGGGVTANLNIRSEFEKLIAETYQYVSIYIPEQAMTMDNAIMIACAAYIDHLSGKKPEKDFRAEGNMKY